ncbi:MAG: DUF4270 domain-containing protein [Paludibacter sp.]
MKSYPIILLSLLSFLFFSCNDDLTDLGVGIRPSSDSISIGTDTFHVTTKNILVESIISRPDSFLLGSFYDEKFGTTQADIFAQLQGPIGVNFSSTPKTAVADSVKLYLYYQSWFGDSYSPMEVNVYEMNKSTFEYSTPYPTNLDPTVYTDDSNRLAHKIITARDASKTLSDTTSIIFKLSDTFKERLFNKVMSTKFTTDNEFLDFFKGIHITANNFGASTMLNIQGINLRCYYHYTYKVSGSDKLDTAKNVIPFPANSEVRQVNRFTHPNSKDIIDKLSLIDSVNYISSPANIQTQIKMPLKNMIQKINSVNGNKQTVNSSLLKVEATDIDTRLIPQPIVQYMLLIKEDSISNFFSKNKLPSDTYAILAPYTASLISNTSLYKRYYTFNMSKLIANEKKIYDLDKSKIATNDYTMRLVPVRVTFNSSNVITAVKPQYLMSSVIVRSGINNYSPMMISMVYSGF